MSASHRFSKERRLLTPSDFKAVFDTPIKKIHSEHLMLIVGQGSFPARLGLAITKKKLKNASTRNHLKRLSRESFRQTQFGNVDAVLIVKKSYTKHFDVTWEVRELFERLRSLFPPCDADDTPC